MNSIIRHLNLDECLFFDIETVRQNKNISNTDPLWNILKWQYRDKELDTLAPDDTIEAHYKKNGGLLPELGKIVCITMGQFKGDTFYIKSLHGDEATIITDFVRKLNSQKLNLIGHNIKGFDLPFIRKRAIILNIPYIDKNKGNDSGIKPWDLDNIVIDTMEHWKGANFINTSLELLCYSLNIPSSKITLRGNEVSDTYFNGGLDEIISYCEADVIAVANIIRMWRNEPLIIDDIKKLTEIKKKGLVEKIKDEGLTNSNFEELLNKVKCFNKDEKEKTIKIINASLLLRKEKLNSEQIQYILNDR